MNIEVFLDWVKDIECFFDYMGTPDDRNVKLVSLKQKGGISAWWDQVQHNWKMFGLQPIPTLKQGTRNVEEYMEEFHRLSAQNNLVESENQQIAQYIDGLRYDIKEKFHLQPLISVAEVVSFVLTVEEDESQRQKWPHLNLGRLPKTLPKMPIKVALQRAKRQQQTNLRQTENRIIILIINLTWVNALGVVIFLMIVLKEKILQSKRGKKIKKTPILMMK